MRKPANTRAMRLISLALVVAMVMCGISGIFSVANAEGETFTLDQVATMAKEVYEAGKESGFAATAKINGVEVDQPTYFILACKALLNIDNGATIAFAGDKALKNATINARKNPGEDADTLGATATEFTKVEYMYLAERQVSYTQGAIDSATTNMPSNYTTLPGTGALAGKTQLDGRAGYARQLTLVLAALASYKDNGSLPETISAAYNANAEYVAADPNATPVPTAGPSLGNFKMSDVIAAAASADPMADVATYKVGGKEMSKASFFALMTLTIVNLSEGKTDDVTTAALVEPSNGASDSLKTADDAAVTEITKDQYINRATRESKWVVANPAPSNMATYNNGEGNDAGVTGLKGNFSYLRTFSVFVRVLAAYSASNALPESVDASYAEPVETPAPTRPPEGTVKANDVLTAAEAALKSFEQNGKMPESVKVGSKTVNQASFFRMMAHVAYYTLGEGQEGDIPVYTLPEPVLDGELADGFKNQPVITKGAYLYAAQRELIYIDNLEKDGTPAKVVLFPGSYTGTEGYEGQLTYQRLIVILARALSQYITLGKLPDEVSTDLTITKEFTLDEIVAAAPTFLAAYNADNSILTSLEVAGIPTNRGQYYKLFVDAINSINKGDTAAKYQLSALVAPDGNGIDSFVADEADEISKAGYLFAAEKAAAYLADGTKTTPAKYVTFSSETYTGEEGYEGQLTYQNQLVIYARVLEYYAKNKALPEKVSAEFTLPTEKITVDFATALDAVITANTYFNEKGEIAPNVTLKVDDVDKKLGKGSYLKLAALLIQAIEAGKTNDKIEFTTTYEPENPTGNDAFSSATISKAGYLFVAQSQLDYMAKEGGTGKPANFTAFGGQTAEGEEIESAYTGSEGYTGNFSMNRACVVLPRVLAAYKAEGKLPAEVDASYKTDAAAADELKLVAGSAYAIADGYVTGVAAETTAADILAQFEAGTIQIVKKDGTTVVDATAVAGTGCFVQLLKDGVVVSQVAIVIAGDATGDGKVNSRDIAAIQKVVAGGPALEGALGVAADAKVDGKINSRDIATVQKAVAGV